MCQVCFNYFYKHLNYERCRVNAVVNHKSRKIDIKKFFRNSFKIISVLAKTVGFGLLCSVCNGKFPPSRLVKINCGHSVCSNHNLPLSSECAGCKVVEGGDVVRVIDNNDSVWMFNDIIDCTAEFYNNHDYDEVLDSAIKEFGLSAYRGCQKAAIIASLEGHNVFVLMPSGGGKSLISTVISMMLSGTSIIICPLHSIIEDQLRHLEKNGIPAVKYDPGNGNNKDVYCGLVCSIPKYKLVFLTPEQFVSAPFKKIIQVMVQNNTLDRVVFDEGHCIYKWGYDFRRKYLNIGETLKSCCCDVKVIIVTATANVECRQGILDILAIDKENVKYFLTSFDRPNLKFSAEQVTNVMDIDYKIFDILKGEFKDKLGIIYCNGRKDCDTLASMLNRVIGVKSGAYHSGISVEEKTKVLNDFVNGEIKVIVATISFGMGVNVPNVRFVIHRGMPKSLDGYYQECGRSGRDGHVGDCRMFWFANDYKMWKQSVIGRTEYADKEDVHYAKSLDIGVRSLDAMDYYARTKDCRRVKIMGYFGQKVNNCTGSQMKCDNCTNRLK